MYHFERKKSHKTIKAAKLCFKAYLAAFFILQMLNYLARGFILLYQVIQLQTSIQS